MSFYDHDDCYYGEDYYDGGDYYDDSYLESDDSNIKERPPEDNVKSLILESARHGALFAIKDLVEAAAKISEPKKNEVLNATTHWREVDYKMSGYTKEYDWFNLTPLALAASEGHDALVRYLLEQGADPTLEGCPSDNVYQDAYQAAETRLSKAKQAKGYYRLSGSSKEQRCADLLNAAKPFWKRAPYASCHYDCKSRSKFTNQPTDHRGLIAALNAVPRPAQERSESDTEIDEMSSGSDVLSSESQNDSLYEKNQDALSESDDSSLFSYTSNESSAFRAEKESIEAEKPTYIEEYAKTGDLKRIQRAVKAAAKISEAKKRKVLNATSHWREVDYKMSGFTKEYDWFNLTPLATAASKGHHKVVQYLLEQGADPTLEGCPYDDVYQDAYQAAECALSKTMRNNTTCHNTSREKRCVDLLNAAKPFWDKASYAKSGYSIKKRSEFSNQPTCLLGLLVALNSIAELPENSHDNQKHSQDEFTICAKCKSNKHRNEFYSCQWTRMGADAKCKSCMSSTRLTQTYTPRFLTPKHNNSIKQQTLQKSLYSENEATRRCKSCAKVKARTEFSNNQWTKKIHLARCKSCILNASITIDPPIHGTKAANEVKLKLKDLGNIVNALQQNYAMPLDSVTLLNKKIQENTNASSTLSAATESLVANMEAINKQLLALPALMQVVAELSERDNVV